MEYQKIVEKVRSGLDDRNAVVRELYTSKKIRNSTRTYVLKNKGNLTDVDDLMTHGVMSFIKQCYRPQFVLRHAPESYVFTIIKYEWMSRRKKSMKVVDEAQRPELSTGLTIEQEIIGKEKLAALRVAMQGLDERCRKVLTMWSSDIKMREIALNMDYRSEGMARKKKHECLGKLRSLIKNI